MNETSNKIFIRPSIARLYITFGVIFMLIFILGSLVLHDMINLLYFLASSLLIVFGIIALKSPYAIYDEKELILFNLFGKIRIKYTFSSKNSIVIKKNFLYLNGEKMKINKWFIQREEWNRMIQFYSTDNNDMIFRELQDD